MARKQFKRAVILAAGSGKRLMHETKKSPKALVQIGGHPLIELIFLNLASFTGIRSAVVGTGHMAQVVEEEIGGTCHGIDIEYVKSQMYDSTNNAYTLWLLREYLVDGFLLINTDVLFDGRLLQRVVSSFYNGFLVVDSSRPLDEEDMKVELLDGRIVDISKGLDPAISDGEYIGIAGFDARASAVLVNELEDTIVIRDETNIYYEDVIQRMLKRYAIYAVDSAPFAWIEVDTTEDLETARNEVYPKISEALRWK